MPNPGQGLRWLGPRLRLLPFSLVLGLCACTQLPGLRPDARDHLDYYAKALAADHAKREYLWRAANGNDNSPSARLHRALMRSLPGHSGYDAPVAVNNLVALTQNDTPPEIQSVARMRLAEMSNNEACQHEADSLRQRLTKMVGIERKMSGGDH